MNARPGARALQSGGGACLPEGLQDGAIAERGSPDGHEERRCRRVPAVAQRVVSRERFHGAGVEGKDPLAAGLGGLTGSSPASRSMPSAGRVGASPIRIPVTAISPNRAV